MIERVFGDSRKRTSSLVLLALLGIAALGAALRWFQIGSKTIWLDEAFSIWMAWRPIPDMLSTVIDVDQHPPVYYALLHGWIALGGSGAAWVRSLSALAGLLTIPAIFLLAHRLAGDVAGLLAAVIFAISPLHIAFAQETRMYALHTLFATLSLWATVRLLTDPRSASMPIGQQLIDYVAHYRRVRREERRHAGAGVGRGANGGGGYERDYYGPSYYEPVPRGG